MRCAIARSAAMSFRVPRGSRVRCAEPGVSSSSPALPYWRLSAFYFAYFGLLGAMVPFWSLFLQQRGFSLGEIALLAAIPMATRIIAPNLWGWIADHRGTRMPIVRFGALATMLVFSSVFLVGDGFWGMALVMTGFSFFWNAVLPQFEVITLDHLGERLAQYSRVRLWGSVGFIVAVVGFGALFDILSVATLPAFMLAIMFAMWLSTLVVHERPVDHARGADGGFRRLLREPVVWVFLFTCLLVNLTHGPYYTYFSIYMEGRGWSRLGIGGLWAVGVVAEVIVFIYMHRILARVGAVQVLALACAGSVVRWLLLAWLPDSLGALLFAQLLHAVTFGFLHASAIHIVYRLFTGAAQGRGQALFASVSYGIGGALGALAAGGLWLRCGPQVSFTAMAGVGAVALLLTLGVLARHPLLCESPAGNGR